MESKQIERVEISIFDRIKNETFDALHDFICRHACTSFTDHFFFQTNKKQLGKKHNEIVVSSPKVKHPVAVRYCFRNFQIGNLKNHRNLPVIPFRTDNW